VSSASPPRTTPKSFGRFNFNVYLRNSLVVTIVATLITLVINSMAAFALSKYKFKGRNAIFLVIISTLMIPISVILVPVYLVITEIGWVNNLWGVIIPGAATPTGVFLLRQYMLTIPDELLDSGRIDGASEWRIYWQIVLPLAAPALAVLAIFSVMWRWNDFLWPLIVLSRSEYFTFQVGLNAFQGELNVQWHFVLAMTVLTLLPITMVFALLQRFITTASPPPGSKGEPARRLRRRHPQRFQGGWGCGRRARLGAPRRPRRRGAHR
jgi:alpha-1,4-digalacturonate transport system permease protein